MLDCIILSEKSTLGRTPGVTLVPPGAGLTARNEGTVVANTVKPEARVPVERSGFRTEALRVPSVSLPESEIMAESRVQDCVVLDRMLIAPGRVSLAPLSKFVPETLIVSACPSSAEEGETRVTVGVGRPPTSLEYDVLRTPL